LATEFVTFRAFEDFLVIIVYDVHGAQRLRKWMRKCGIQFITKNVQNKMLATDKGTFIFEFVVSDSLLRPTLHRQSKKCLK